MKNTENNIEVTFLLPYLSYKEVSSKIEAYIKSLEKPYTLDTLVRDVTDLIDRFENENSESRIKSIDIFPKKQYFGVGVGETPKTLSRTKVRFYDYEVVQ